MYSYKSTILAQYLVAKHKDSKPHTFLVDYFWNAVEMFVLQGCKTLYSSSTDYDLKLSRRMNALKYSRENRPRHG